MYNPGQTHTDAPSLLSVEQLGPTNYSTWYIEMQLALTQCNLWALVSGSEGPPIPYPWQRDEAISASLAYHIERATYQEELIAFHRRDSQAKMMIWRGLHASVRPRYGLERFQDAQELWAEIRDDYVGLYANYTGLHARKKAVPRESFDPANRCAACALVGHYVQQCPVAARVGRERHPAERKGFGTERDERSEARLNSAADELVAPRPRRPR